MTKQLVGSLQNRMMEMGVRGQPEPVVGMGVTELMWTDRRPFEIVRVELKKDGSVKSFFMKSSQWSHGRDGYGEVGEVNNDSPEIECRQNRKGQWCEVIAQIKSDGTKYRGITKQVVRLETLPNKGQAYYDPHF